MSFDQASFRLSSIEPSRDGLLAALRPLLTQQALQYLAKYDGADWPGHLEALCAIKETGVVQTPLDWNPAEVCNLCKWDAPTSDVDVNARCAFASWILVNAYVQPLNLQNGLTEDFDEHAIVSLCERAIGLGPEVATEAARFLYWAYLRLLEQPTYRIDKRPFYLLGLLVTSSVTRDLLTADEFARLCERLEAEDAEIRSAVEAGELIAACEIRSLWVLGLAGDDLNEFDRRCVEVVERVRAIQSRCGNERETALLTRILDRWRPTSDQES